MKKQTLSIILSSVSILICQTLHAQSWLPVGPNDTNMVVNTLSIGNTAVNQSTGDIFVCFPDPQVGAKLTVRKFNGISWRTLGTRGISTRGVYTGVLPGIVVDRYNNVYVLYADSANDNKATVQVYNGTSWSVAGTAGFSAAAIQNFAMAIDTNGIPYVIYGDTTLSGKAVVKKLVAGTWVVVGTPGFSAEDIYEPCITIDKKTNLPFIAYRQGISYGRKVVAMKYNDTSWVYPGPSIVSDGYATYPYIITDSNSVPYIGYSDMAWSGRGTVKTLQGRSWVSLGSRGFATTPTGTASMAFTPDGTLYLYYGKDVQKYDGTTWLQTGNTIDYTTNTKHGVLISSDRGDLYLGFKAGNSNQYTVCKLQDSVWQRLDTGGISNAGIGIAPGLSSIMTDTNGVPFVCYINTIDRNEYVYIKTYTGGNWIDINTGFPILLNCIDDGKCMALNTVTNIPYLAYVDTNNLATVKMYSGGGWTNVGAPGFITHAARAIQLTVSPGGTPYVLYSYPGSLSDSAFVMKYDGTNWLNIGGYIFSGNVNQMSIAITKTDTPYVAYINTTGTLTVKKYNGTDWAIVDDSISGHIVDPLIALDKADIPYIGYTNTNYDSVYVEKLEHGHWHQLKPISKSRYTLSSLIIDNTNRPIISYSSRLSSLTQTNNSFSVRRYNDSIWEYIGPVSITTGDAITPCLSITRDNTLYCAYQNSQYNVSGSTFALKYSDIPTDTIDTSTSVENIEPARSNDLYAYPVPCTDHVTIAGWDPSKDGNKLYVYDISGKLAYSVTIKSNRINTASWPSGIYFLETYNKKILKIIKQ